MQYRKSCTETNFCNSSCGKHCKKCRFINCYRFCNEYTIKKCTKLNHYPYACNSCSTVTTCTGENSYYKAKVADTKYTELLVTSREGLNITANELRKKCTLTVVKESNDRVGRTFNDFVKFIEYNPNSLVVEMDIVHLTQSGKVLLTFMFRTCSLMLAFIIDSCSQTALKDVISKLYKVLGHEVFRHSFPVILTDNSSEFKKTEALELDTRGNQRTKIFYCNPMASYHKPHVEKNH